MRLIAVSFRTIILLHTYWMPCIQWSRSHVRHVCSCLCCSSNIYVKLRGEGAPYVHWTSMFVWKIRVAVREFSFLRSLRSHRCGPCGGMLLRCVHEFGCCVNDDSCAFTIWIERDVYDVERMNGFLVRPIHLWASTTVQSGTVQQIVLLWNMAAAVAQSTQPLNQMSIWIFGIICCSITCVAVTAFSTCNNQTVYSASVPKWRNQKQSASSTFM